MKNGQFTSLGLGIRYILAKNDDNRSRYLAVIITETDEIPNGLSKTKTSLCSVNQEFGHSVSLTGILIVIFYYVDLLRRATGGHVVIFSNQRSDGYACK